MIYASVCSGVGSCRLAAPSSWECAFFAEIEPFPSAVLAHHFPEVPNHGDFTQIGESAGPVDVLVGGTPCQSFSVAGKRAGLDSPNGNLAIEFARLAQRLRARWIVWENVPGVLSSVSDDGSSDFDTFLGVLEDVGYSVAWTVLDAQHFGVPQRRRRVFVVGYLGDWRPPAAVLFEPESLRGHSAPEYEAREDVAGTLGGGAGERGWSPDTDRMTFVPTAANSLAARVGKGSDPGRGVGNVVAHALDAHSHGAATEDGTGRGVPLVAHALSSGGADASEDGTGRGTPLVPVAFDLYNQQVDGDIVHTLRVANDGGLQSTPHVLVPTLADPIGANEGRTYSNAGNNPRLHDDAGELSPTLRSLDFDKSHANGGGQVAVAFQCVAFAENQRGEIRTSDTMQSLSAAGGKPGSGYPAVAFDMRGRDGGAQMEGPHGTANLRASSGGSSRSYVASMQVRRLTPRECERLQGYPDDWTLVPYRGKPASDGPRYRAIGNGWAVPVVAWIFRRLDLVEEAR